jgi:hypothetical protein
MYSALLLEDFITGLRRNIALNDPVSTFIAGLLAGVYSTQKPSVATVVYKGVANFTPWFDLIEGLGYKKFSTVINKFTTPIDKVVKSIKDGSFITPSSKFYDIIQYGVTLLLLFLGFIIGKLISFHLSKEKQSNLVKQFKKYLIVNIISFTVIFIIASFCIPIMRRGWFDKFQKIDFSTFKDSDNIIKRAVAKAYDLVITKYPEFAKVPLYYVAEDDVYGFYCIKYTNKSVLGIPYRLEPPLTEDELIAIYLHEFGHLLNVDSGSSTATIIVSFVVLRVRMFTKMTNLQLATELGSIIIDRFFAAVASFNQEMTADVFAASMGYGPQLRSALRKLEASMTGSTTTSDQTNAFIHKFLSHPTTDKRVDYIEQVEKHFKQQTNKLIQKSTEVITTELNKEKASV